MKDERIFIQLIGSLEAERQMFCNGLLHKEKEFIDNILRLQRYISVIENSKIKEKVQKFVDSVLNHKNYAIFQETLKKAEEREKQLEMYRQQQAEIKRILQEQEKEERRREQEYLSKTINEIENSIKSGNLINAITTFNFNSYFLRNHCSAFYLSWYPKIEIMQILEERKIRKLIHFTDYRNLQSILENGIIPRQILEEKQIKYFFTDAQRYEKRIDCSSLSIEYPNYKMLHMKKNLTPGRNFVILVLDAKSILLNDIKKYYVYINAANKNAAWWLENETLSQTRYLKNMFQSQINELKREENCPKYLTTDPQAEILANGIIDISDILEVHFADNETLELYKQSCTNQKLLESDKFIVNNYYFHPNRDDINWEER